VIAAIFIRRLKEGKTFDDFKQAWEAEQGFGAPARVLTAVGLADPREILTIGLVDLDPADLEASFAHLADQEHKRHTKIEEVIESTELRSFFAVTSEHDFSADPQEIPLTSPQSLLAPLNIPS
jgi:hypothetical protein